MNDKISVIVPVHNLEVELTECIKSIQSQTYSNIEIIIVDDGSTDGSREVINELAKYDYRIKVIFKENGGVTSARISGVQVATGTWVGFVDGDDRIEPDMYEFLLYNAKKYEAQISHCGYQMCFPDGRVRYFYRTGDLAEQDQPTALKELLAGARIEPSLCNKLFHKNLFHSLLHSNVMDQSIRINEDLLMNYYLFKAAEKSVYEDRCPYHYIVRNASASRQGLSAYNIYDPIKVKRIILEDVDGQLRNEAMEAYLRTCINVYNSMICDRMDDHEKDKETVRELIMKEKLWIRLLNRKTNLLGKMICDIPSIYSALYRIYEVSFQEKRYS